MTYKQALQHMKKDLKNIAEYKGTKYGVDYKNNLMVKTEQGTWLIFEPTEAMKLGVWEIPSDQLGIDKDCSNCDKKIENGKCMISEKAMEYIGLEGEHTPFCCSLHGYKEE